MCFLCDVKHSAWQSRRGFLQAAAGAAAVAASAPLLAQVDVGASSSLRTLVPAGELEAASTQEYTKLLSDARAKGTLAPPGSAQLRRLRHIAGRLVPQAAQWNDRAKKWRWEVNLIDSKQINAFCMPGGKIAFYTGILTQLRLTDDEAAMIMGHEMAHALREHARARLAKSQITNLGANLLGELVGGGRYAGAFQVGGNLLTLKFSRDDESEADVVGLDLAARAGFDPRAGISLWQKMAAANSKAPLEFLSTHPAGDHRIKEIEKHLPEVMPLYAKAHQANGK